jgi:hypothetical protein
VLTTSNNRERTEPDSGSVSEGSNPSPAAKGTPANYQETKTLSSISGLLFIIEYTNAASVTDQSEAQQGNKIA